MRRRKTRDGDDGSDRRKGGEMGRSRVHCGDVKKTINKHMAEEVAEDILVAVALIVVAVTVILFEFFYSLCFCRHGCCEFGGSENQRWLFVVVCLVACLMFSLFFLFVGPLSHAPFSLRSLSLFRFI